MQSKSFLGYALLVIIAGGALYFFSTKKPMEQLSSEIPASADVILKTNKGDIGIDLYLEQAPITAGNFLKLAKQGFYNKTTFHRVIQDFMIQGGDPTGTGTGGPGYTIQDEFVPGLSNVRGTISMANTGAPNSGGSQFFINVVDNVGLDYDKPPMTSSHAVFGMVVSGMDVVDAIVATPTDLNEKPVTPIVIESVEVRSR
jgi:peptidylprolyl isomerase